MAYEKLASAIIGAESGGRANARNPRSSAGGAGQFIDSTWVSMIAKHRPDIAAGKTREQILQLKFDPSLSAEMTQRYAQDNAEFLAARGIEPTEGALSLAHFSGPAGAAAIYADPGKTVTALLGEDAVRANPFLRGKTGADVIAWADKRVGNKPSQAASMSAQNAASRVSPQEAAPSGGIDRLASAVTGSGYDADRMTRGKKLQEAGQSIAAKYHNPYGAIGGTIVSGIGGFMESQEADKRKADEAQLIAGLSQGVEVPPVVAALLKSSTPEYRQAGMEALLKLQGPKAAPDVKTVEDQFGRKSQYVWNSREGRYEPFSMSGQRSAPVESQEAPQAPVQPQAAPMPSLQPMPAQQPQEPLRSPFPVKRPDPTGDAQLDQLTAAVFDQQQPTQPAPAPRAVEPAPAPAAAQSAPSGLIVGGPVPKAPDGFVHKQSPDGRGFLYQQDGTPVLEPKSQAEERGKVAAGMEQNPRVAEQFRGGIEQLSRFPEEFGATAFERAVGPWQADATNPEGSGTVGTTINYVGQFLARSGAEVDAIMDGGASPTEVRDRIGTATKNLAAVMKPLVRKPGEGAWSDKDQANLEKQIGELSRARSVGEYKRRLDDIRENVAKIFTIDVPKPNPVPRSPNAPATAEQDQTWFERGPQSYLFGKYY